MHVYRITLAKYANALIAPGTAGRWNSNGVKLIYTASSISLACLENLVHRSHLELQSNPFKVITIYIPDIVSIEAVETHSLPLGWSAYSNMAETMIIGNNWVQKNSSCLLQVPSVINPEENNFLINPANDHFSLIHIESIADFIFDERLKR